eukprot:CAMPEP_0195525164 /NCGR_PEP_ID=MMETSP0794_2-20130614/25446_1 /TAXON_ID=515487 /ORGANISM="Stephanopyxis turris, Strain CCMP 815" /LENGTH=316 /DNA_ID=CAMNT_0040655549 /DNA_START=104 /DNA_END=1054 /DNA_ORIENTATION=-
MERKEQKTRGNKQRQLITLFRKKGDEVNNWFRKRKTSLTIDDQASNSHCLTCNPTITSINGERHVDINHKISAPLCCCCICLSEPKAHKAAEINGCEHVFCFECIDKWSKRENTCPLCKVPFTKIVTKGKRRLLFYERMTKSVSPKKQSARPGIFAIQDDIPLPVTIRDTTDNSESSSARQNEFRHGRSLEPSEPHSMSRERPETENPDESRTTFPHHTVTPSPCHPTGVVSFSRETNTKEEGPHWRDMLLYLNKVKLRFQYDQPHVYDEFFHMMQYEEMENGVNSPYIIERVAVLFRGHNDLILNFNALLPYHHH